MTSLPTNLMHETTKTQKEETIWCDVCLLEENKKVQAFIYCHDCDENICQNCDSIHKRGKFKKHKRDLIKKQGNEENDFEPTKNCRIHKNTKLTRYCNICQKLICSECSFEHSGHETISFDQPIDFYQELINEQKKCTQGQLDNICQKFEQLNYSEKSLRKDQKIILNEISEFYTDQKKLVGLLEENEKKKINNFFSQIYLFVKIEKQKQNNSFSSTQKRINQLKELETSIEQSEKLKFYHQLSKLELQKKQEKTIFQFPRFCQEHKNPFEFFCLDCNKILCSHCAILNHTNCKKSNNLKEGYEKIQNELEGLINDIKIIHNEKKEFIETIKNEKNKILQEKQKNINLVKKNYQKLNALIQHQFKNMVEEISYEHNDKYLNLNDQLNHLLVEEENNLEKSEMFIKEIEVSKKYNNYLEVLINYFKLLKLKPILNKKNQLICDSKFEKISSISKDFKQMARNWKLKYPKFDIGKTQITLPSEILLENKIPFTIILKNQLGQSINAKESCLYPKISISTENSNEMITEITNFEEWDNNELKGELPSPNEGGGIYNIHLAINDQKHPESPFKLSIIDEKFLKDSEILQKENNPKFNQTLEKWVKEAGCNSYFTRCFNSRTDGWRNQTFHQKCDNKGKSILLVKCYNGSLFGGFAAVDWDSRGVYKQSTQNKSFLFSLISLDQNFTVPLKLHVFQNKKYEIGCDGKCGPTFGGRDLCLGYDNYSLNNNQYTISNLGYTYKAPFGYTYKSEQVRKFFVGSTQFFEISKIEVFCEEKKWFQKLL
ncbi:tripartite motif-containing 33-like [Anaeramoeba flamelloides]|uniref:Tripartite motif-containing 33-like n=1 Tax=Anaeramoeba flamelloides TaxID=1746091 RepID=A0AAV7ZWG5_9EUKA|nr:tripartite motif-containing 33-like [Anaeramoeba flamelloides]